MLLFTNKSGRPFERVAFYFDTRNVYHYGKKLRIGFYLELFPAFRFNLFFKKGFPLQSGLALS